MLVRIISGAVLLLLMGTGMVLGGWWLYGLCLCVSLVGLFEFYRATKINNEMISYVGYVGTVGLYMTLAIPDDALATLVLTAMTILWMGMLVFGYPKFKVTDVALGMLGFVYVAWMMSYIFQTRQLENGIFYVWLIFISAWGSDSFAYLAGITLGRHSLAPELSPKKSIEGAIGGIVGATVLGGIYGWIVIRFFAGDMSVDSSSISGVDMIIAFMAASALGAVVSIVGDLAASAVKRFYGVKDYGSMIPGHGGVMDRFDSCIFTAPIVYWVLYFVLR